jgi:hypothetical protein
MADRGRSVFDAGKSCALFTLPIFPARLSRFRAQYSGKQAILFADRPGYDGGRSVAARLISPRRLLERSRIPGDER